MQLVDIIARGDTPYVTPIIGFVSAVNTAPASVDIALTPGGGAAYPNSRYLDGYTPAVGHVVFGVRHPKYGVMVLGRIAQ